MRLLLTNSSEITVVLNLNMASSSEGVPTLNLASKFEFPKSLDYATIHPTKPKKQKWPIFYPFHGLLTHRRQHIKCQNINKYDSAS